MESVKIRGQCSKLLRGALKCDQIHWPGFVRNPEIVASFEKRTLNNLDYPNARVNPMYV